VQGSSGTRRSESGSGSLRGFTLVAVSVCVVLRWAVALGAHSGQGRPPLFGDYEAQRHWQEITLHLPLPEWYRNTSANDLSYWGLDYPPLTAYHSWAMGVAAHRLNASFVALHASRGEESERHRLFMRASVLVADLLCYLPPLLLYMKDLKVGTPIFLLLLQILVCIRRALPFCWEL